MTINHTESGGHGRYSTTIDGYESELEYLLSPDGRVMRIVHTGVPSALSGRGIGAKLVAHAVEDARKRGLKVVPSCSFAAHEFGKHPEYADVRG